MSKVVLSGEMKQELIRRISRDEKAIKQVEEKIKMHYVRYFKDEFDFVQFYKEADMAYSFMEIEERNSPFKSIEMYVSLLVNNQTLKIKILSIIANYNYRKQRVIYYIIEDLEEIEQ